MARTTPRPVYIAFRHKLKSCEKTVAFPSCASRVAPALNSTSFRHYGNGQALSTLNRQPITESPSSVR